tara:strand:+ start:11181 stop:11774 length:594 start_codon:yes stop_codon:yes gene_type:complete
MKTTVFSTHKFEDHHLISANNGKHKLNLLKVRLTENTASLAEGSEAISLFTSDEASAKALKKLSVLGIKFIALRTAGYNNVATEKAGELGIKVSRVPDYSPFALAEHTILVDTKTGKIGYFGMDVYEEEEGLFFEDHSDEILQDDVIARLMTFNNVLITSHQAFLTDTALTNIADTTIYNLDCFEKQIDSGNEIASN